MMPKIHKTTSVAVILKHAEIAITLPHCVMMPVMDNLQTDHLIWWKTSTAMRKVNNITATTALDHKDQEQSGH